MRLVITDVYWANIIPGLLTVYEEVDIHLGDTSVANVFSQGLSCLLNVRTRMREESDTHRM